MTTGISIPAFVREELVARGVMDYADAVRFSDAVDAYMNDKDWLESYDGTQWNVTETSRQRFARRFSKPTAH